MLHAGSRTWLAPLLATTLTLAGADRAFAGPGGVLRIEVVDRDSKAPLACRMHLTNAAKKPLKAPKVPFWHDHFVFDGSISLKLPKGEYDFEIERGPEYLVRYGHFTMNDFSDDTQVVDLKRFIDMSAEGWWSGDLDVRRPAKDLKLLMSAEELHVAELVSGPKGTKNPPTRSSLGNDSLVEFDQNYFIHLAVAEDRPGGSLLFLNPTKSLDSVIAADAKAEFPPLDESIAAVKKLPGTWVDAQAAWAWDLPIWVARGELDSIELAGNYLTRKPSAHQESSGKPRDKLLFPGSTGAGRWNEKIYYHLLNCGLRIVPTAGSGSGYAANSLGYNRMYVYVEAPLTYEKWWQAVREGRVVVTNGPLIRPNVDDEFPGHVFRASAGTELELEVGLTLSTRDRVSYLEIIANGQLAHQVRLDEWAKMGGKLPPLSFHESGWFVIRAVADTAETYRFASTAPYYVEIGGQPRISKSSAQFFLDWLDERTAQVTQKLDDPRQREAVLKYHRQAHQFWSDLIARANAP